MTSATCVDGPGSRYQAARDNIVKGDSDDLISTYVQRGISLSEKINRIYFRKTIWISIDMSLMMLFELLA